jgi:putative peptide zinc metalloprotease protein
MLTRDVQLSGLLGLPEGESQRQVLMSQRAVHEAELSLNRGELARLVLRAPFDGQLEDLDRSLARGTWVQAQDPLAVLVAHAGAVVDSYVSEADLARVKPGQSASVWLASDPRLRARGEVQSIDVSRVATLPDAMLDAKHGGPIPTAASSGASNASEHAPRDAVYRVRIRMAAPIVTHAGLVKVHIEGERESMAASVMRRVAAVLIRESGF